MDEKMLGAKNENNTEIIEITDIIDITEAAGITEITNTTNAASIEDIGKVTEAPEVKDTPEAIVEVEVADTAEVTSMVDTSEISNIPEVTETEEIAAAVEGGQIAENSMHYEAPITTRNQSKNSKHKKLLRNLAIFIAIALRLTFDVAGIYMGKIIVKELSALYKVEVHDNVNITINQNDKFTMPDNVAVKLGNGRSRAVRVEWDKPIAVDSSNLGTQVYKGKVEGYGKTVNYTINVLRNSTSNKLADVKTYNSQVDYDIDFNASGRPDIKYVLFTFKKDGNFSNQFLTVINGYVKGSIYLPFGPGTYIVTASINKDKDRYSEYVKETEFTIENEDKRELRYLAPTPDVQSTSPEIINMAREITKGCYSDMQKTRAIHDWVASNIAYDIDSINNGTVHEYSAIETLQGRKAVCNGYANLTAALNRAVGIKTRVSVGWFRDSTLGKEVRESTHAWNETYIDGRWVIQDTTWDAGYVVNNKKFVSRPSLKYFDPDILDFAKDHVDAGYRE